MEMLMKETRSENFLRNSLHRGSLAKQIINNSSSSLATNTAAQLLPLNRKKIIKNTSFDQAEFEKLISNTTNHNKLTSYVNRPSNILKSAKSDKMKNLILNEYDEGEEDDDDYLQNSSNNFKKNISSAKTIKTAKSSKTTKTVKQTKVDQSNLVVKETLINLNNSNEKAQKKNKKPKKKKVDNPLDTDTNIFQSELTSSKSSFFPKMIPPTQQRNNESFNTKLIKTKPIQFKKEETPATTTQSVPSVVNESLRWDKRLDNPEEERKRIDLYKINRRKRYIEQRNKFLNLTSINMRSTNNLISSSMYEHEFYNDMESNSLINADTASIYDNKNSLATGSTNNLANIFNKMKLKERSNITDSAISSMSSNSR